MDFGDGGLIVRNWFRGIGITEAVIEGLLILAVVEIRCSASQVILIFVVVIFIAAGIKAFIWSIVSIILFAETIQPQCEGRIYDYGLALVIIHSISLASACCECIRKKRSS